MSFFFGLLGAARGCLHIPASTGGRPPCRKDPCALLLRKILQGSLKSFQTCSKREELVKAVRSSLMTAALIQDEGDVSSLPSRLKVTEGSGQNKM